MNPRQRRGLLLLLVAVLGAVGVFAAVLSYVGSVSSEVGPMATALRVSRSVPAYATVTADVVERVQVPSRWLPATAMHQPGQLRGQVAAADIPAGSYLQSGMLMDPPSLEPGQREIAIKIDAETGVAGQVQPGDLVDIIASFAAAGTGTAARAPVSETLIRNAHILVVGSVESVQSKGRAGSSFGQDQVVPITFALSEHDALALSYAEVNAASVRLARIAPGDTRQIPSDQLLYQRPTPAGAAS